MLSFSCETYWQTATQALLSGRTFPSIRLLGLIEDHLAAALDEVLKDELVRFLTHICQRLDLMTQDI